MKQRISKLLAALILGVGFCSATNAHAALTLTLGGQGVYDNNLKITWLQNANLAASNAFGVSGISAGGSMYWDTAQSWVAALNTANYLGYGDWRLPKSDACIDINCTGSEMGHLFYNELGGVAWESITTTHNDNYHLFSNIQTFMDMNGSRNDFYWSGTEKESDFPFLNAFAFHMGVGYQGSFYKDGTNFNMGERMFAWAVRDGDSPAVTSPVPEPETYSMLLAGLGLLSFTARRRK